jgi:hypothetical protein
MAELYIRQGFTDRGLEVYRQLVERDPGNLEIRGRLEELESAARGDPSGEDAPAAGAAISDAPAGVAPQGTGIGTPDSEERADSGTDGVGEGDERAIPVDAGAEDDPWGSAPQWTGGDPETGATDRSPFAWVPDPEDAEGEEMSEIQGPGGDAVQEAARGRGPSAGQYLQDLLAWEPGAVPIESLAPEAGPGEAGEDLHEESLSSEPGDDRGQDPSHPGSRGE